MGADGPTAADVVNTLDLRSLARVIAVLGEEKRGAGLVAVGNRARRAHRSRSRPPAALAEVVSRAVGGRRGNPIHPATRTFQALRIFVNRELDELAEALAASERILGEGGRLVVVAFHSLEDRIVKRFLADRSEQPAGSRHQPAVESQPPSFTLVARGGVAAGEAEVARNPRARSARLRAAAAAPPRQPESARQGNAGRSRAFAANCREA